MWNIFFGIALLGLVAGMAVLCFRMLSATKDKVDRGDAKWEDDWDPFT